MTTEKQHKTILTVKETAAYLGLAESTLNKWRCIGGGPKFQKLGRAVRYSKADLDAFLENTSVTSTSEYSLPSRVGKGV